MRIPFLSDADTHMREVVRGAGIAFVLRLVGAAIQFLLSVVIARLLGADGTGIFFLALTVATVATVFGRLGLDNVMLRLTAAHSSEGDWSGLAGAYRTGITLAVLSSIVATIVVFGLAPWIATAVFSKPELGGPLRWMSLAIAPTGLAFLYSELLKGLKQIFNSQFVRGVLLPALAIPLLYVLVPEAGTDGAAWAYVLAAAGTCALAIGLWYVSTPGLRGVRGTFAPRQILDRSLPLLWVNSLAYLMSWTATFLLGVWGTAEDVGVFSVASRTATLITVVLLAVNSIAAPKFAQLYQSGDMSALGSTARQSARLMTVLAAPALAVFILAPGLIMRLFGPGFGGGAVVLVILAISQFVNVAAGSVGYLLMMTGHERTMRNTVIGSAAISVALNVLLIPFFGVTGAAVATAVALVAQNVFASIAVYRLLDIRVIEWAMPGRSRRPAS